ncbi:unnamed protein product [Closterium sp. Naga37s-1]|nr:unnamed protein product [Closterium sp. Naga37s-1]
MGAIDEIPSQVEGGMHEAGPAEGAEGREAAEGEVGGELGERRGEEASMAVVREGEGRGEGEGAGGAREGTDAATGGTALDAAENAEGMEGAGETPAVADWPLLQFSQPAPACRALIWQCFRADADADVAGDVATDVAAGRSGGRGCVEGSAAGRKRKAGCERVVRSRRQVDPSGNFLKGVKWSPDGTCLLASSEDCCLRLFDLPADIMLASSAPFDMNNEATLPNRDSLAPAVMVREGETIYDFAWFPAMSAADPVSCVFASTSRDHPVHLWDAMTGQLRCTYRSYDHLDEIAAALSLTFSSQGDKLVLGFPRCLRVFDTSIPGRDCQQHSTGAKGRGQTGLLSCLATNPYMPGLLAVGSYDGSVGLYGDLGREAMAVMHGHAGGVTQVLFSRDGNFLYSGARKDPAIRCWDVRNTSGVVYSMQRSVTSTNQRIAFDIDPSNRHLATGGEDGQVWAFDLATGSKIAAFQAAQDTVNGFAFHPCLPLAATSSGHRRFHLPPPLTPASPPEADSHAPEAPAVSPDEGPVFLESTVADVHNTLDRLHSKLVSP